MERRHREHQKPLTIFRRVTHQAFVVKNTRKLTLMTHDSLEVAVGAAGSPTPIGRFAVTDQLTGFNTAAYGCCILALSGHQTNLPSGWTGGDRLAIHGGDGIGSAVSSGCLHAGESDLRWLLRRVPLGTQVVVHP